MKGGEVHAFEIALEAGQFLQLSVNQRGIDLVVTLLDPGDQRLLEIDNLSGADGAWGPERVVWVAEVSGRYGLTLRAWSGNNTVGRYELTVEELRPAEEGDRKRTAAERALAAANALYWQGQRTSRRQAIDRYEEALAGFLASGDGSRQADARYGLGQAWQALGESSQALEHYQRALTLYVAQGNARQQALTLHVLCGINNSARRLEEALELCHRAIPLWEETGDRLGRAKTSNELGYIYRRLGEGQAALTFYDEAIELWSELGKRPEEAQTLHNRGRLYSAVGKKEQALVDLHRAADLWRRLERPDSLAATLNALGQVHSKWDETAKAYPFFRQALETREAGQLTKARSLIGIARLQSESGEAAKALASARLALEIFRTEDDLTWEGRTLQCIGWLLASQGEPREALDSFRRALAIQERIRARSDAAVTLLGMASVERERDHLQEARRRIEAALAIKEDLRSRVSAVSDLRAYYSAINQDYYDFYVDLLMELHLEDPSAGHDAEALAASERARARSLLEILTDSRLDSRQGIDPAWLARQKGLERRINAKEIQLMWLQENPSSELRDVLEKVENEQRDLLREYEKLRGQIRLDNPRSAALAEARTLSAEEIQRVLDPDTLLLEYRLGEKRSLLWAVTPQAISSFLLPGRAEIERIARRAYDLITRNARQTRQRARRDLALLSDLLLGPVAAQTKRTKRLLIVSDGVLQYLPFGALPAPGTDEAQPGPAAEPLVAEHEVVTMPSASTLAVLRDQLAERAPAPRMLAVLADPVFGSEDPRFRRSSPATLPGPSRERAVDSGTYRRLAYSGREAEAVLALVPVESRFEAVGFDASREAVLSGQLGRYRIVHFATHGDLNTEHPELSRLVLSLVDEEGHPRDGFLHAYEIYNLELGAELVVLSACQTALGRRIRGEGLVGLTRGFLHAGAARVVVSLWNVNDSATAELMERFYQHLLIGGLPPAAALRAAQNSIRQEKRWREPYYWAGFVLQGEWKDLRRSPGLSRP